MGRGFAITLAFFCLFISACKTEKGELREIRGHTVDNQGVAHASAGLHANRYCSRCHGVFLDGGSSGEPSCFKCHGIRWAETESEQSFAPAATHVLNLGGVMHKSEIDSVQVNCASCHGQTLQGSAVEGTPSCLMCHEKVWDQ